MFICQKMIFDGKCKPRTISFNSIIIIIIIIIPFLQITFLEQKDTLQKNKTGTDFIMKTHESVASKTRV